MPSAAVGDGLIGPNAVLQLFATVEERLGVRQLDRLRQASALSAPVDGTVMIPEQDAIRAHRALRALVPQQAKALAIEAGRRTADYIIANRIPKLVVWLLKALPAGPSAALLSRAITNHAWTFAGSGRFACVDPFRFRIADNPLARVEHADNPICVWHAAVFERLYQRLVAANYRCEEVSCCAQATSTACEFRLFRSH